MYSEINNQLSKLQGEIHRLQKLTAMIQSLSENLSLLEEKARTAQAEFEKEDRDYQKIQEKSLSAIIFSVLGKLDERQEKERQEAVAANIKYQQCLQDIDDIKHQLRTLEAEKQQYQNAQAQYDRLYQEKRELLIKDNAKTAAQILDLDKQAEQSNANLQEIEEALTVGKAVELSISQVLKNLGSANDYGTWDLLGGGIFVDLAKHSQIDQANAEIQKTQSLLRCFHTELTDINISADLDIDISSFDTFADFVFDGFLFDWMVQSKINTAQQNTQNILSQVQAVMGKLKELQAAELALQKDLEEQIRTLVLQ